MSARRFLWACVGLLALLASYGVGTAVQAPRSAHPAIVAATFIEPGNSNVNVYVMTSNGDIYHNGAACPLPGKGSSFWLGATRTGNFWTNSGDVKVADIPK